MRKISYKQLVLLAVAILSLMSIPEQTSQMMRGMVISGFSPAWESLFQAKIFLANSLHLSSPETRVDESEDLYLLQIENQHLRTEVARLQLLLEQEYHIEAELLETQRLAQEFSNNDAFFSRRYDELKQLIQLQVQAMPAQVIFRGISSWNSSIWVNIGWKDNQRLGRIVIARNSPVTVGFSLVGIVDYVGSHQSRVRLITDSGLNPSVRASRGYSQNKHLERHIDSILESLNARDDLFSNPKDTEILIQNLIILKQQIEKPSNKWLLAKGELHGGSKPLWRSSGQLLKGVGFNYDFADEEGPARDLRTGKTFSSFNEEPPVPLLKVNDLLVTTGMDGVFPPGLHVAEVVQIDMLREGNYTYELIAKPTVGALDELTTVFILPPVGYDESDQPEAI